MTIVTLESRPVPFQRTGSNGRQRFTPSRYRRWREAWGWEARLAHTGHPWVDNIAAAITIAPDGVRARFAEITDPGFTMEFDYIPHRPKHVRGDIDNYVKAVLDASQGIVFVDDRQVVLLVASFDTSVTGGS